MFGSRMTPAQLAKAKGKASTTNHLNELATTALTGSGATRAEREHAQAALEKAAGSKRKAERLKKDAVRRVAPKRGWFG